MKTAEEILNQINPLSVRHDIAYLRVLDCMKAYAKQCVEQALKDASDSANLQRDWKSSDGKITETETPMAAKLEGIAIQSINNQSYKQKLNYLRI